MACDAFVVPVRAQGLLHALRQLFRFVVFFVYFSLFVSFCFYLLFFNGFWLCRERGMCGFYL